MIEKESNINELLMTNYYDIIANVGIISITSYYLYYLFMK
jgi:hypothetical protein